MRPSANFFAVTVARFYTPLVVLFALSLLAVRAPDSGVGFVAGLAGALALVVHALVFGADVARKAVAPALARALLAMGLIAVAAGAGAPRFLFAPQVLEAGLFAVTVSALSLVLAVLIGRAPTLRDETM